MPGDPTTIRRLYGRSKGRPLRPGQAELVETLLPQVAVPEEGPIDSMRLFGDARRRYHAVLVGGDPLMFFMGGSELPDGTCEYDVVGGLRGVIAGIREGNRLPTVPNFQISANASYSFPVADDAEAFVGASPAALGHHRPTRRLHCPQCRSTCR